MGYQEASSLQMMKSLWQHFWKLAVEKHSDKGGTNEKFKELYQAYEILGNMIASKRAEEEDMEEIEARRMFREENWEEINSASITIRVKSTDGDGWESMFKKTLVDPKNTV